MRRAIPAKIRRLVAERASHRCEYCHMHEEDMFLSFEIDHVVNNKHGGGNETDNLAYACPHCNSHKGSDLTTFLDCYDDIVSLFNPRKHEWTDHFAIFNGEIRAKTRIGQGSVKLFRFNEPDLVVLRQILMQLGRYP